MKGLYISGTRLAVFWTEIPLITLLVLSIIFNKYSDALYKLYPLIVFLSLAVVFCFIYFFKIIKISYDEIRYIGLFSGRDKAMINEGKTVIVKNLRHGKFSIILFGHDGFADFDWLKKDEGEEPVDIALFRGKGYGGKVAIRRILRYFGVDDQSREELIALLTAKPEEAEKTSMPWKRETVKTYEFENVTASVPTVEGKRELHIVVTKTV